MSSTADGPDREWSRSYDSLGPEPRDAVFPSRTVFREAVGERNDVKTTCRPNTPFLNAHVAAFVALVR